MVCPKEKAYFSENLIFPSETQAILVRFCLRCIARRCFWEPPGTQLGLLGRSWGSRGCSWDASETRRDLPRRLLGGSGPLLESIWPLEGVPRQLGTSFWGPCGRFSWVYYSFPMRGALHDSPQPRARRYVRSTWNMPHLEAVVQSIFSLPHSLPAQPHFRLCDIQAPC